MSPDAVIGRVAVGGYVLALGNPAGAAIGPSASRADPRALARAFAGACRESSQEPSQSTATVVGTSTEPPGGAGAGLEGAVKGASGATEKAERALKLFTEVSQGRLDPAAISDEVDALLELLRSLDHE